MHVTLKSSHQAQLRGAILAVLYAVGVILRGESWSAAMSRARDLFKAKVDGTYRQTSLSRALSAYISSLLKYKRPRPKLRDGPFRLTGNKPAEHTDRADS